MVQIVETLPIQKVVSEFWNCILIELKLVIEFLIKFSQGMHCNINLHQQAGDLGWVCIMSDGFAYDGPLVGFKKIAMNNIFGLALPKSDEFCEKQSKMFKHQNHIFMFLFAS